MIIIKDVEKKYGGLVALSDVSLFIKKGEALALLGPNGAGKSTLLKCLLGLLNFEGEIFIDEINLKENLKLVKSNIAYVPQEPAFYDMRIKDILKFYMSLRNVSMCRANEILDQLGLSEHSHKLTTELSGGMKQKLSFAIALLADTSILLLDEPTSNLDIESRKEILKLIKKLIQNGKTIVFTSHRIDEVFYIADQIIFLESGKVIKEGSSLNLQNNGFHKTKIDLFIPKEYLVESKKILLKEGYRIISSNEHTLSLEVDFLKKVRPIKKLLENKIDILDFIIDSQNQDIC